MTLSWSLSLLLLLLSLPFNVASGFSGEVVGVVDGDTVEVMHNGKAQRIPPVEKLL